MSFQKIDEIEDILAPGGHPSIRDLYAIWEQRLPIPPAVRRQKASAVSGAVQLRWVQGDLSLVTAFTEQVLLKEEYLLLCDVYDESVQYWKKEVEANPGELIKEMTRLSSHYATARTRLGFTREARQVLEPLVENRFLSRKERARILLQIGDIVREESVHTPALAARRQTMEDALGLYQRALAEDPQLLEAMVLNAAITFILSDRQPARRHEAESRARDVLASVGELEDRGGPTFQTHWFRAVAEGVLGRLDEAVESYARLQTVPGVTTAQLAEARYRSQFLAEALGVSRDYFKTAFPPLQLLVFAGHLPDLAGTPPRFPPEAIPEVRAILRKKLDQMQARVGFVSAAAGADLLFIEALQERAGAQYHLVLPWSQNEFFRTSIGPYEIPNHPPVWKPLFDRALEQAATIRELGQVFEPSDTVGWEFTKEATAGLALLTARTLRLDVQPIVLWDGNNGRGAGGTASFVELWTQHLREPPVVLDMPSPGTSAKLFFPSGKSRSESPSLHQEVKSLMFADIVGYSKLTEKVIRDFVELFMHRVSLLLASSPHAPRNVATWGDAIHGVFDFSHDAGKFALELTQMIRDGEKEWIKKGLFFEEYDPDQDKMVRCPLNIRIGLHTGPVYAHYNPVMRQLGFTGSHVSRAARIEPVAERGEVYASEEFAAMAELSSEIGRRNPEAAPAGGDGNTFACEYAGSKALAKNYPGRFRIYRVVPQRILATEELAQAAHALYCEEQARLGKTPADNSALRPWNELAEDLRDANRAQVADIPNKLSFLGYELAPSNGLDPLELEIDAAQLEALSVREHDRWMRERLRQGWTYGPERDDARKHHPSLIPWEALSESEKQKDRDTVVNLRRFIKQAGFRVRKLSA
jgi:class 3 adenylate cyclase